MCSLPLVVLWGHKLQRDINQTWIFPVKFQGKYGNVDFSLKIHWALPRQDLCYITRKTQELSCCRNLVVATHIASLTNTVLIVCNILETFHFSWHSATVCNSLKLSWLSNIFWICCGFGRNNPCSINWHMCFWLDMKNVT